MTQSITAAGWLSAVEKIKSSAQALRQGDDTAREALISHAFALITALETPSEFVMRTTWAEVCYQIHHI